MIDRTIARLLDGAAAGYAAADRPTVASLHRGLRCDVRDLNHARSAEGLAPLACPSLATLRRRVGSLDASLVHATRYGRAVPRRRDRSGVVRAVGGGPAQDVGRRLSKSSRATIARRLDCRRATAGLLLGMIETGGDAPDRVRASMLLDAQDRLDLHVDVDFQNDRGPAPLDRTRPAVRRRDGSGDA